MIEIQKFVFNEVFENTYVVWDTDTLETAIIDCGCMYPEEKTRLKDFIQSRKLKPTLLLNTHMHFDHCCGNSFVAEEWHLFPQTHRAEIEQMPTPSRQLELFGMQSDCPEVRVQYIDTDTPLKLGKHDVRVLFVPGHSPGHLAFYIPDAASVFVGDVLFLLEIGRCDLWGGSLPTLLQSARTQLFVLPPDTTVYCGHGPETSIGYEMENNPYFR